MSAFIEFLFWGVVVACLLIIPAGRFCGFNDFRAEDARADAENPAQPISEQEAAA